MEVCPTKKCKGVFNDMTHLYRIAEEIESCPDTQNPTMYHSKSVSDVRVLEG